MKRALPLLLLGLGLFSVGLGFLWGVFFTVESPSQEDSMARESCVLPAVVNYPAPDLTLVDLEGNQVQLKDTRGKVVLLNAWATWCPPCLAEMPDLQRFYELHRDDPFTLLGVNIGERSDVVEEFIQRTGLSFPIWLDPEEETLRALKTISLPTSIVVDPDGIVRLAWSGATCLSTLESVVSALIP